MLKNKEERKQFILNDDNWEELYNIPEIAMVISSMLLPDGTKILKYVVQEEYINTYTNMGKVYKTIRYRIKIDNHVSDNVSMTFLIDLLGKVK